MIRTIQMACPHSIVTLCSMLWIEFFVEFREGLDLVTRCSCGRFSGNLMYLSIGITSDVSYVARH